MKKCLAILALSVLLVCTVGAAGAEGSTLDYTFPKCIIAPVRDTWFDEQYGASYDYWVDPTDSVKSFVVNLGVSPKLRIRYSYKYYYDENKKSYHMLSDGRINYQYGSGSVYVLEDNATVSYTLRPEREDMLVCSGYIHNRYNIEKKNGKKIIANMELTEYYDGESRLEHLLVRYTDYSSGPAKETCYDIWYRGKLPEGDKYRHIVHNQWYKQVFEPIPDLPGSYWTNWEAVDSVPEFVPTSPLNISGTLNLVKAAAPVMAGDVSGDGKLDGRDALRLARYLAGQGVTIDEKAADVTGDGKVDGRDVLRLTRYLAGQDVKLGK